MVDLKVFDRYDFVARVVPSMLAGAPLALGLMACLPQLNMTLNTSVVAFVLCAAAVLLAHFVRDGGKALEPILLQKWGGLPSVRALSYEAKVIDQITLRRRHRRLENLDPELRFPENAESEASDRPAAFAMYKSASEMMRNITHDRNKFPLVFAENVNYGFRRNLLGLREIGAFLSAVGGSLGVLRSILFLRDEAPFSIYALIALIVGLFATCLWLFRVTPEWVRMAADEYANQMLGAIEQLE